MTDKQAMPDVAGRAGSPAGQDMLPGGDLLSSMGHELRGPVGGIIGLADIMLRQLQAGQADRDRQLRQLQVMRSSAGELLAAIERIVEVAKLDACLAVAPSRTPFDSRDEVNAAVAELEPVAADHRLRLVADLPDEPVPLIADPAAFRRILHELIDNALRYTDGPGVLIRIEHADRQLSVSVSDDGPGIPAGIHSRIFSPFVRGEAAARRGAPAGCGLGLYLARRLAQRCGLSLELHSDPGQGSTFMVGAASHQGSVQHEAGAAGETSPQ